MKTSFILYSNTMYLLSIYQDTPMTWVDATVVIYKSLEEAKKELLAYMQMRIQKNNHTKATQMIIKKIKNNEEFIDVLEEDLEYESIAEAWEDHQLSIDKSPSIDIVLAYNYYEETYRFRLEKIKEKIPYQIT